MNTSIRRKRMIICMLVLSILTILTGCQNAKSDTEVKEELEICFVSDYPNITFDEINIEIQQRQTNKDEKVDYVWLILYAENETVSVTKEYEMTYVLYNEGWQLEAYDSLSTDYVIKYSSVTEEQAKEQIENQGIDVEYDQIEFVDRITELDEGIDTFIYHGIYSDGYVTVTDEICVEYEYIYYSDWALNDIYVEEYGQDWAVLGKWQYKQDDDNMWIVLHEISEDKVLVEYDFDYSCEYESAWYGTQMKVEHYISDGMVTRYKREKEYGFGFPLVDNESTTPYVYVSKDKGVTFDGVWFNDDDTYVFEYVNE